MNFSKIKKLTVTALMPLLLLGKNNTPLAGNVLTSAKNKTYYETHDMSRIILGTFSYSEFIKRSIYDETLRGPWRIMAYKKIENNPKFKSFFISETSRQLITHNTLKELSRTSTDNNCTNKVLSETSDFPNFQFMYSYITDNRDFEKIVANCRKEWNFTHNYKDEIKNPEEALEKALKILKPAFKDEDPFSNERVIVSYDPLRKIYIIKNSRDIIFGTTEYINCVLLSTNGDVLSIDCQEKYLLNLM